MEATKLFIPLPMIYQSFQKYLEALVENKSNKEIKVAYILLYVSCATLILLVFLSMKYSASIESLGGSLIFIPIMAGLFLLFFSIKPLALEFSLFALIISGILAINFFGYLEEIETKLYLKNIYFLLVCIFITFYVFAMSFMQLTKSPDSLDEFERSLRSKLFLILVSSFIIITPFIIISTVNAGYFFSDKKNSFLNHSTVNVAFIILSLIISLFYLSKIKDEDIKQILDKKKYHVINFDSNKVKKYLKIGLLLFIVSGSVVEMSRGLWLLWGETILLLGLMTLVIWKIYKHVFSSTKNVRNVSGLDMIHK
ncbi:hypothetical protein HZA55_06520 [Candidatus Poribacteria bacterium]|nr:hypothetical protein [Candidatus Poribacteria bacterium]